MLTYFICDVSMIIKSVLIYYNNITNEDELYTATTGHK